MKKQTKKHILEFLHFWPMTIVVPILLLLILFPGLAGAKEKYMSQDYSFWPEQDVKWAEHTLLWYHICEKNTHTHRDSTRAPEG